MSRSQMLFRSHSSPPKHSARANGVPETHNNLESSENKDDPKMSKRQNCVHDILAEEIDSKTLHRSSTIIGYVSK